MMMGLIIVCSMTHDTPLYTPQRSTIGVRVYYSSLHSITIILHDIWHFQSQHTVQCWINAHKVNLTLFQGLYGSTLYCVRLTLPKFQPSNFWCVPANDKERLRWNKRYYRCIHMCFTQHLQWFCLDHSVILDMLVYCWGVLQVVIIRLNWSLNQLIKSLY